MTDKPKSLRGFASMDPELQRQIASKGGRSAHANGKAHTFSKAEAKEAGRLGGEKVSADKAHMAAIGKLGGVARKKRREAASGSPNGSSGTPNAA